MKFRLDPEITALFEDLEPRAYKYLKEDISERGIQTPLVVTEDGTIVCGCQRYKIAKELGLSDEQIPFIVKRFKSKREMIEYAIKDNILRRQLNVYQKALVALAYLPFAREYTRETKRIAARLASAEKKGDLKAAERFRKILRQRRRGDARDIAAELVGISGVTLEKVAFIEQHGSPSQKKAGRLGLKSVDALYLQLKPKPKTDSLSSEVVSEVWRDEKPLVLIKTTKNKLMKLLTFTADSAVLRFKPEGAYVDYIDENSAHLSYFKPSFFDDYRCSEPLEISVKAKITEALRKWASHFKPTIAVGFSPHSLRIWDKSGRSYLKFDVVKPAPEEVKRHRTRFLERLKDEFGFFWLWEQYIARIPWGIKIVCLSEDTARQLMDELKKSGLLDKASSCMVSGNELTIKFKNRRPSTIEQNIQRIKAFLAKRKFKAEETNRRKKRGHTLEPLF